MALSTLETNSLITVDMVNPAIFDHLVVFMGFCLVSGLIFAIFGPRTFSRLEKIPGPALARLSPFYRIYLMWSGDCGNVYERLHRKYGTIVRTGSNHVVIAEPSAIQTIYGRGMSFPKSEFYKTFDVYIHGKMQRTVFSARDHDEHKELHSHMIGYFSPDTVKYCESVIDTQICSFIDQMRNRSGEIIDFGKWIRYWSLDINSSFAFGHSLGFLEKGGDINSLISSVDEGFRVGALLGMVPTISSCVFGSKIVMTAATMLAQRKDPSTCIVETIEKAVVDADAKDGCSKPCILAWLRSQQKTSSENLDYHTMIGHLANYLLAGSVSSAAILSAVVYYIVKDAAIDNRLTSELRQNSGEIGDGIFTAADTQRMPYLQAVVKEALRLVPSNTIPLERVVPSNGMHLGGHYLPSGTNVGVSAYVIHRNREIYGEDANEFRPERWINSDRITRARMQKYFFSFGRGERGCNARPIGLMMVSKFVAQVMRELDVRWARPESETWDLRSWWMPEPRGLFVHFEPCYQQSHSLEASSKVPEIDQKFCKAARQF